jgi:calcineurin-like phosphoesterase family protein
MVFHSRRTLVKHYGHKRVIEYCNRPFDSVDDMDRYMIDQNNKVVTSHDTVVHIGDFSLYSRKFRDVQSKYISSLRGNHIFIQGSHDHWLKGSAHKRSHIWQKTINKQPIVCCHYAMRTWPRMHYGAWLLFGHSHGDLTDYYKSFDVGVDSHEFRPWSFEEIEEKMSTKPNNPNNH